MFNVFQFFDVEYSLDYIIVSWKSVCPYIYNYILEKLELI